MSASARGPVRVRVPATSANLGPGFDALGLALQWYDDVTASVAPGGVHVEVTGEGAADVPRDDDHLVVRAMRAAFDLLGEQPPGIRLVCTNRIPHSRGLGSSAAAIVAGVLAARALSPHGSERLDADQLLRLAARLEGHPDNVAACLHGGLTIAWSDGDDVGCARLDVDPEIEGVAWVPAMGASTAQARGLLPAQVPHADAARNAGRAALLVAALTGRRDLLAVATDDRLHQPYRASAMPASAALVAALRADGVPAVVSGAGPTVLALAASAAAGAIAGRDAPGFAVRRLGVDQVGAVVSGPQ